LHLFLDKVMTQNRTVTLSRCHALQSQSVKNANAHFVLFVPFECLRDFFLQKMPFCNMLTFSVLHNAYNCPAEAMLLHAEVALLRAEEPPLHPPC